MTEQQQLEKVEWAWQLASQRSKQGATEEETEEEEEECSGSFVRSLHLRGDTKAAPAAKLRERGD